MVLRIGGPSNQLKLSMNTTLTSYIRSFEASPATEKLKLLVAATRRVHRRKQLKTIKPIATPTATWKNKPTNKN